MRFITGYMVGITVFLIIIPYGFYQLSRLDYLVNYQMLIGPMVLRYAVSAVFFLIGLVFVLWSNSFLLIIGEGGPADALGVAISPRTKKLVTRGPYRFCRNPMVFGAFSVYLSLVLFLNSFFGLTGLLILLLMAILYLRHSEEKRLLHDFGDEFLDYKKKVPMIIPIRNPLRKR
jgi:protein-S-isoprenylcysteine O-methyltransferase Ste14